MFSLCKKHPRGRECRKLCVTVMRNKWKPLQQKCQSPITSHVHPCMPVQLCRTGNSRLSIQTPNSPRSLLHYGVCSDSQGSEGGTGCAQKNNVSACVTFKIIRIGCNVRPYLGSNFLKTIVCSFCCVKAMVILLYSDMVIRMRSFLFQSPGERGISLGK